MRARLRWFRLGAWTLVVAIGFALLPSVGPAAEMNAALSRIFSGEAPPASVAELRAMQEHLQQISNTLIPCTVGVRVGQAQGSGVIISEDGYVLTAAHVNMRPNIDVTFILHDGRTVKGKTLGLNRSIDAGLMKIHDEGKYPYVEMGNSKGVKEGQWCVATGHPGGYERGRQPVVRFGRVLRNQDSVITSDCTLVGGDSGGPLFDMEGRVIGINSRIAGPLNVNMHVPVDTYRETWERLVSAEAWGSMPGNTPFLGVQGEADAKDARIGRVYPDTPAEKAGIQVGDVILEFDGKPIDEFATLSKLVGDRSPGDKVKIRLRRGEETIDVTVTIGKRTE
jgi:serine protease Do